MTQENKELLLIDLCARLPYEVMVECSIKSGESIDLVLSTSHIDELVNDSLIIKPYLRPMSSMTEEEKQMMDNLWKDNNKLVFADPDEVKRYRFYDISIVDFLNTHHFDYRGLIERNLGLKAKEGMYNN